jgi:mannitol-1-/sugar-/sorbitol-6-phosphatase
MAEPRAPIEPVAAVFDLDGTLVLSDAADRAAWRALFASRGRALAKELLESRILGRRDEDVLGELTSEFPGETPAALAMELSRYEAEQAMPFDAVTGAVELVHRLHRRRVALAVVTSARRVGAEAKLAALGLLGSFSTLVVAEDVAMGKPHPEGYRLACRRLGVDPSQAVGFEDSPSGVAAVKSAGMRCVAVATSHDPLTLGGADLIVPDLATVSWPPQSA